MFTVRIAPNPFASQVSDRDDEQCAYTLILVGDDVNMFYRDTPDQPACEDRATVLPYQHRPDVLEARLTALARRTELYTADNFAARAVALDLIQQVYQLLQLYRHDPRWGRHQQTLQHQAGVLEQRLRQADADWFQRLRYDLRHGAYTPHTLRRLFDDYTRYRPGRVGQIHRGYDTLDALMHGLLSTEQAPVVVQRREIDMIAYEPTPARVILDLVDQVGLTAQDVFYDIGAGLGHVVLLVHLMTQAVARGVEIEAAYCRHAQQCAEALGLSQVHFVQSDARQMHYADGTVFFMYTPFTGEPLHTVLAGLHRVARNHAIVLCTYGACTFEVVRQPWLRLRHAAAEHAYALAVFTSVD